jgi:seryl-tRNA synthetase
MNYVDYLKTILQKLGEYERGLKARGEDTAPIERLQELDKKRKESIKRYEEIIKKKIELQEEFTKEEKDALRHNCAVVACVQRLQRVQVI